MGLIRDQGESNLMKFYLINADFQDLWMRKIKSQHFIVNSRDQKIFESDILELFYDAVESIIKHADLQIHEANLSAINEHVKAKILENELKEVYNELFKRFPAHAAEFIAKSAIPTKKELEQSVIVR